MQFLLYRASPGVFTTTHATFEGCWNSLTKVSTSSTVNTFLACLLESRAERGTCMSAGRVP